MVLGELALIWLRRDLRLHDHGALHRALACAKQVQMVFILDTDILVHFPDPHDRRLSFIARTLTRIDADLQKRGGGLIVMHGSAKELLPKLARTLGASHVVAAQDYEPGAIARDQHVAKALDGIAAVEFVKDQVIFSPTEILRGQNEAYKVFTPYAKIWRASLTPVSAAAYTISDKGRYADMDCMRKKCASLDASSPKTMLQAAGYTLIDDDLWPVDGAQKRLEQFITHHSTQYKTARDMMAQAGTSRLSPYLRFGLVSVRECVAAALKAHADTWLSELIWREFYATILYHYPQSAHSEWNSKYRGKLNWSENPAHIDAWKKGMTGYPVVDAAMRQLLEEGWMHNRARMVVASFLTKHLRVSWRVGEAYFAQYLMDYDMASNVGGWQWAASTGTDAQPYFRIFNPVTQSEKFDPDGEYIRRYVPELSKVKSDAIHAPWKHPLLAPYIAPIVEHSASREAALAMFKAIA